MPISTGGSSISNSSQIADGVIINADVNANAAIDASKVAGDVETTGAQSIDGVKTFTSDPIVPADVFAAGWNGNNGIPTKNDVYDKIVTLVPSFSNGVTTKNAADASTTQNIAHGLGAAPKRVRISALATQLTIDNIAICNVVWDSSGTHCSYMYAGSSITSGMGTSTVFYLTSYESGGGNQSGVITVDATNIIITWTKNGNPSKTFNLLWEAE